MFKSVILSLAAVLSIFTTSIASANEVDYNKAYRVVHNVSGEILSWVSFEPVIVWEGGHPYVSMKEFDSEERMHNNLYSYHEIILEPIPTENIIR